jgi:hypothetical protein
VSCYTRHLDDLMPAGLRPEARRRLDAAVRQVVGMPDQDCPEVWEVVKRRRSSDAGFADAVTGTLRGGA